MNEQHSTMPPQVEGIITKPSSFSAKSLLERLQEAMRSRSLTMNENAFSYETPN